MTVPSDLPFYDRVQIGHWLGTGTVDKALAYVCAVSNLEWDGDVLSASVNGTQKIPYEVNVFFDGRSNKITIDGTCTCPVGYGCKHVAAVLLAKLGAVSAPAHVRSEVVNWLERFRQDLDQAAKKSRAGSSTQGLAYVLVWSAYQRHHEVQLYKAGVGRDGSIRSVGQPWHNLEQALLKPPQFVSNDDMLILRLLWLGRSRIGYGGYVLTGTHGAMAVESMLATGRLFTTDTLRKFPAVPLRLGNTRMPHLDWETSAADRMYPVLHTEPPSSSLIFSEPVWYVDEAGGEAGVVEMPWDAQQIAGFLSMPPISMAEAQLVGAVLRDVAPDLPAPPMPPGHETQATLVQDSEPMPVLNLSAVPAYAGRFGGYGFGTVMLDYATVSFDYAGFVFSVASTTTLVKAPDGSMVHVKRRPDTEKKRLTELQKTGLKNISSARRHGPVPFPPAMLGFDDADGWHQFMQQKLPSLRANGWRVVMAEAFNFNVVEIDVIDGRLDEAADGWFDMEMGIVVADRTVRLEPLLAELFQRDRRWLAGDLDTIADDEAIDLRTEQGERLRLRAERLKPVVRILIDLFDSLGDGAPLRISRFDAGRLEALNDTGRWQFHGDDSIRQLAQRLKEGGGVTEVSLPDGLCAALRPYQHEGVSWMQFLREHALSGVLADDMGLGKTIQTLAHLLLEKEAGRLDRPALIVMPTSLVHNWCEEARRFAPGLRVLSLHGSQRKTRFDDIAHHDLILTTYALLWRDQDYLAQHRYHFLILDEAQLVKNAGTKSAATIRHLDARHRLCLTGTPLENHLGELWSLFDFLLPGFLGSQKEFAKRWRTPIEKGGDTVRRDLLARRIRPFMLRRRKDDVAKELPPKTLIVRSVDLEGAQRDLYETVRTAMHDKVRTAISEQGLNRSHIVVLDALLKLRQVCCDPRLVKLDMAAKVHESAKLDLLLSMLPELIDEGRRVLLFSQFTGMLTLIAAQVEKLGIPYVMLTGDTTDRATPVRRFQAGEVPLFLISLKAGGVGLNLTAADTVIHYDPWWNPAAENQATDRAHRLGQDKPVFVYKLIVAGSIEEKIVALQEKKAALAEGILSDDGAAAVKFTAADLEGLFAPMPSVE